MGKPSISNSEDRKKLLKLVEEFEACERRIFGGNDRYVVRDIRSVGRL